MKFLGDVVAVEHIKPKQTGLVHIPENVHKPIGVVPARVIGVGTHCKLEVVAGDTVFVQNHLGTRNIQDMPEAIIYDSEDVLAKLETI